MLRNQPNLWKRGRLGREQAFLRLFLFASDSCVFEQRRRTARLFPQFLHVSDSDLERKWLSHKRAPRLAEPCFRHVFCFHQIWNAQLRSDVDSEAPFCSSFPPQSQINPGSVPRCQLNIATAAQPQAPLAKLGRCGNAARRCRESNIGAGELGWFFSVLRLVIC